MPKIHRLPKALADLIAAGEVVERPASVVKELLENSIDAGAHKITLEIQHGGVRYIRVTDDGCGIAREDIRNAFVSHATSKISTQSDLEAIATLGFRGEALSSAAAVARVEIMTRTQEEAVGTHYCIEGGEEVLLDDAGCPHGTTLVVRDLFYNTPARMKFLKKDVTEANAVAGVVDRIALSHPEVGIRFIREGKEMLCTPGDGQLDSTIYAVFGKEFLSGLLPVDYVCDGIGVKGYVSKPIAARQNRSMQFFFLNGRYIKTGTGSAALSESYKHAIMAGKFPACVLNITVPNNAVDVNVHPAKIEVRFANEKPIFNAIYYGVKNALEGDHSKAHPNLRPNASAVRNFYSMVGEEKAQQVAFRDLPKKRDDFFVRTDASSVRTAGNTSASKEQPLKTVSPTAPAVQAVPRTTPVQNQTVVFASAEEKPSQNEDYAFLAVKKESVPPTPPKPAEDTVPKETNTNEPADPVAPEFRVIGEAFNTYIFVETDDKIWIIDKHAAHERMLYEQFKADGAGKASQMLLTPVTVTLRKEEYAAVLEHEEMLADSGFAVADFGTGTVAVTACPIVLDAADAAAAIEEFGAYLCRAKQELVSEKMDWIYHNTACRAAIKAGDFTSAYERQKFTEKLLSMPNIRTCPHGRPVMIEMTRREMEKSFGRV